MTDERSIDEARKFIRENSLPVTSETQVDYIVGSVLEVQGSQPFPCERCGQRVYLSDGMKMMKQSPGAQVVKLAEKET